MFVMHIDCGGAPFAPEGLRVQDEVRQLPARVREIVPWHPLRARLYQSSLQQEGIPVAGTHLLGEMYRFGERVLPAQVLDALAAAPRSHVPASWKMRIGRYRPMIFFFGTIYADHAGEPIVRGLSWAEYGWREDSRLLTEPFHEADFIALWHGATGA